MNRATDARGFAQAIAVLAETFGIEITATRTEAYYRALDDLPWPAVEAAMTEAGKRCDRFPVPARIRELAGVKPEDAAEVAWAELVDSLRRDAWHARVPTDPIASSIVRAWWGDDMAEAHRWWTYGSDRDLDFKRLEWTRLYGVFATRSETERVALTGSPRRELPGGQRAVGDGR